MAEQASGRFLEEELLAAARDAIDVAPGTTRGPTAAPLSAAAYVELVTVRNEAIESLPVTTDDEFEAARAIYGVTGGLYKHEQPAMAEDADIGVLFGSRDSGAEIGQACIDLITILGYERRRGASAGAPNA